MIFRRRDYVAIPMVNLVNFLFVSLVLVSGLGLGLGFGYNPVERTWLCLLLICLLDTYRLATKIN